MKDPAATLRTYFAVFGALIVFTILTVLAAEMHLPESLSGLHTPIAFAIAGIKALLVLLFFMHLWHSPRLFWLIAFGALMWFAIMVVLTFADYLSRPYLVP
jgi:cytochrome c oxidase subunit 4